MPDIVQENQDDGGIFSGSATFLAPVSKPIRTLPHAPAQPSHVVVTVVARLARVQVQHHQGEDREEDEAERRVWR